MLGSLSNEQVIQSQNEVFNFLIKLWSIIDHSFLRLFAHSEDPDIDEPYQQPVGHVLGESELNVVEFILLMYIVLQLSKLITIW